MSTRLLKAKYALYLRSRNLITMGVQRMTTPDVVVIGEYHGANLGDVSLWYALAQELAGARRFAHRQTLHSLRLWPHLPGVPAIVGGGNVLNADSLTLLEERYGAEPERLSLLGVDFNFAEDLLARREFLNSVRRLTFRSSAQAGCVREMLNREDVISHPDLAFALKPLADKTPDKAPDRNGGKIVGFNVLPLYLGLQGSAFTPIHGPDDPLHAHFAHETEGYLTLMRRAVSHYRARGFRLMHFPFAVEDDLFARTLFADEPGVMFRPFSPSVPRVLRDIRECDLFIPTRFHALVFCLLARVPCLPISYAKKCQDLLHEADATAFDPLFIRALSDDPEAAFACVTAAEPLLLAPTTLERYRETVAEVVRSAL